MKKYAFAAGFLFLTGAFAFASVAGLTSPLDIGIGVRAQTLGGAFVSGIGDSASIYFNPAGLDTIDRVEVQAASVNLLADSVYQYAAAGIPTLDYGSFGLSFARLGTSSITLRDTSGTITGSTSQDLIEIIGGWGSSFFIKNLTGGISLKLDYQGVDSAHDTGFAADMGLLYNYESGENRINAGLIIKNMLEPQIKLENDFDSIARYCTLGLSWLRDFSKDVSTGLYADFTLPTAVDFEYKLGVEVKIFKALYLRAGYDSYSITSVGAGLDIFNTVSIDYGMFMSEIDTEQRVSLKVMFGDSITTMRSNKEQLEEKRIAEKAKELVAKDLENAQKELEKLKASLLAHENEAVKGEYFKSFHYVKGLEGYYANDYKLSYAEFETVYKDDPNYLNIKYYYALLKNIIEKQGTQVYGEQVLELYRKGVDKYMKEDYKGAKAEWEKILAIDPYNKLALENIKEVSDIIMRIESIGGDKK
jgi:tetratricopeptide (TPR) repeat protein